MIELPIFTNSYVSGAVRELNKNKSIAISRGNPMGQLNSNMMGGAIVVLIIISIGAFVTIESFPGLICLLPVLWIGVLGGIYYFWGQMMKAQFDPPMVTASNDQLQRGETFTFLFEQTIKQDVHFQEIKIQFLMREWVQYSCGTDTCTATHDTTIREVSFTDETITAGNQIRKTVEFTVPTTAPHTFYTNNNRIVWLINVVLDASTKLDFRQTYEVKVIPEIAL